MTRITDDLLLGMLLFVVSTGAMLLTFNAVIVVLWIGCWALAVMKSTPTRANAAVLLLLAVMMFYPEMSTAYRGIHEKVVVLSGLIAVCALYYLRTALRQTRRQFATRFAVAAWMIWGFIAYVPIVVAWVWITILDHRGPAFLLELQHATSGIKTAAPVLSAALAALVIGAGLRDDADFRAMRQALELAVIIIATVSLVEWGIGRHFVPVDSSRLIEGTTRLEGLSTLDSNAFGRLLLFPALLFASAALTAPRSLRYRGWAALLAAVTCILMTQSRTSYISFTIGLAVLALLHITKLRLWWYVGAAAAWVAVLLTTTRLGEAFAAGSERLTLASLEGRKQLWVGALTIIKASPWFGAYPSGYLEQMGRLGLFHDQVNAAHSLYLAIAVEWGIPMVLIALIVMAVSFKYGLRAFRLLKRRQHFGETRLLAGATAAATAAYAAHGVSEVISPMSLFLLLGFATVVRRNAELIRSVAPAGEAVRPGRAAAA